MALTTPNHPIFDILYCLSYVDNEWSEDIDFKFGR